MQWSQGTDKQRTSDSSLQKNSKGQFALKHYSFFQALQLIAKQKTRIFLWLIWRYDAKQSTLQHNFNITLRVNELLSKCNEKYTRIGASPCFVQQFTWFQIGVQRRHLWHQATW